MTLEVSHQGLRWRMDHADPHPLPWWWSWGQMWALWVGWWVLLRVMADIVGAGKREVAQLVDLAVMGALGVGHLVALGVTLARWRWNWTEIDASPHELVLRWRFSSRRLRWSEIERIEAEPAGLLIVTVRGSIRLDRGPNAQSTLQEVARWLEVGRLHGFELPPAPAPPRALQDLRYKLPTSR